MKLSVITFSHVYCRWEQKLQTSHLPEMAFGENTLILKYVSSGTRVHFNAFDALCGWKHEALPPVEVPAAAHGSLEGKQVVFITSCNQSNAIISDICHV